MEPLDPHCLGMKELPHAHELRSQFYTGKSDNSSSLSPELAHHFSHGLAYTTGSALGSTPPTTDQCLEAFIKPNKAGIILSTGARAWTKHSHRSQELPASTRSESDGWWGTPTGPAAGINEKALILFWQVMNGATWRNLHWLPHRVLVYEARVAEGYGMRWSQDQGCLESEETTLEDLPWTMRGFVEPMMENGHDVGWRHLALVHDHEP